jgi:response regulator RpfG family c-di-GMP phosphodiesterase
MREMTDLKHDKNLEQPVDTLEHYPEINILIVEDNPDMQHFLKFLLQKNYRLHIAENGEEGFKSGLST